MCKGQLDCHRAPAAAWRSYHQLYCGSCSLTNEKVTGGLLAQVTARISCEVFLCCAFSTQFGENQSPECPEWVKGEQDETSSAFWSGICCCLMNPAGIWNHFIPLPKTGLVSRGGWVGSSDKWFQFWSLSSWQHPVKIYDLVQHMHASL